MTRYAPESDIGQRTKGFYELWPRHDSSDTTVNCHADCRECPAQSARPTKGSGDRLSKQRYDSMNDLVGEVAPI